jgi:hypothetical protein
MLKTAADMILEIQLNTAQRFMNLEEEDRYLVTDDYSILIFLEEASNSLTIIEHDPLLYEGAREMTEYVSQAMGERRPKRPQSCFAHP